MPHPGKIPTSSMAELKVKKAPKIETELYVPGDKSISHRAVIFSSLSNGTCVVTKFLNSEDCLCTVNIMRALGVEIEQPEPTTLIIKGCKNQLKAPTQDLYCGNSGTGMRLLAGLLAAQPFRSRLTGDASLQSRPMRRIIDPLRQMGANISAEGKNDSAPLVIEPAEGGLNPITYDSPVASAQVKSAILIAGLFAKGKTTVNEPAPSRDHTERMLRYYLISLATQDNTSSIRGGQIPESRNFQVPGDISSAAFWLVAASAQPGAHLLIKDVGLNDTRNGILSVLVRMGAKVREIIEDLDQVERMGTIEIRGTTLKGTIIEGKEIPNVIDEIPVLAVAAALAEGKTIIRDAKELRVKECDRISAVVTNLQKMGVPVVEHEDGMGITGGAKLKGAKLDSFGDHRIAMAFAIAGLFAEGETVIQNTECIATSYPTFIEHLNSVMKPSGSRATTPVISTTRIKN